MNTKLPYGAGSVLYRKENTHAPYVARRYKGTNANGNPSYLYRGSYPTKEEAHAVLLSEASFSPKDLILQTYTFEEVFSSFQKHHSHYSISTIKHYTYAYLRCEHLFLQPYQDITVTNMRTCVYNATTHSMKLWLIRLFKALDKEAKILGMHITNESDYLEPVKESTEDHVHHVLRMAMEDQEVEAFQLHKDDPYMYLPLLLCYTGLRNSELRYLTKEHMHLKEGYFIAGMKTEAGYNRIIPIHPFILPIIESLYESDSIYLIPGHKGKPMNESIFRKHFQKAIAPYVHRTYVPHEARHTFVTKLMNEGVSDNIIRKLVGHKIPDASYRFYYHPSLEQLKEAISHLW